MIVFQKIKFKNFLGVGDYPIELDLNKHRTSLFVGKNGSGKSSYLDALCFALFGKPFRKINKNGMVNSVNKKNCLVELDFSISGKQYKITRGIKPGIFEIYVDGTCINQDSTTKDYQNYLEKFILRMNFKTFTQVVILGSASFTPFMKLNPQDRRSVIEDLLDIQVFSVMNNIVKQRVNDHRDKTTINRNLLQSKLENQSYIKKNITSLELANKQQVDSLLEKNRKLASDILNLEAVIEDLENRDKELFLKISKIPELKEKKEKVLKLHTKIDGKIRRTDKELTFFKTYDNCPTCRQVIESDFKENIIQVNTLHLQEYNEALSTLDTNISSLNAALNRLNDLVEESSQIKSSIAQNKILAKTHLRSIKENEERIKEIDSSDSILEENRAEYHKLSGEVEVLETEKKELLDERLLLETSLNLLKDGGIKTKIIKQYLPIINKMINKYLLQLGCIIQFEIDENFNEVIKSRYREEFTYNSFSEGQKDRIDLSILFAWRSVAKLKNSVNTNLLIFDEIFDGSMDNHGTEEFIKIINDFSKDTNIIMISHKSDAFLDKFDQVLSFEQKGNFSFVGSIA